MTAGPGPAVRIRPATAADAAAVHELTRRSFAAYARLDPPSSAGRETEASVAGDLAAAGGLLAEDAAGAPVGALRYAGRAPLRWVRRLAVRPDRQGEGIGRRLVGAAAELAAAERVTALRCGVRTSLARNVEFFVRLGFRPLADHDHWVELGRPLPRPVAGPDEMRALGMRLAGLLAAGDVVLLVGPLGAGKTVFAQGVGAGLDVTGRVTSPTFVLSRRHRGRRVDLVHADAYRLGARAEFDDLDLDSDLPDAVVVVEWGEDRAEGLAADRVVARIERPGPGELRRVTLSAEGPGYAARQQSLDALTLP